MKKMTLRVKIFSGIFIILLLSFLYLVHSLSNGIRTHSLRIAEESLVETAQILSMTMGKTLLENPDSISVKKLMHAFDSIYASVPQAKIYGIEKEIIENRVYVTNDQGKVIFDSYHEQGEIGKDYSQWNDVYLTLHGSYGARTSVNDPIDVGSPYMYVAAPIKQQDTIVGVLSVGKPINTITEFVRDSRIKLVFFLITVLCILILGVVFLITWISRPMEKLTSYARQVAKGDKPSLGPKGKGFLNDYREIKVMTKAIDDMRFSLEGQKYIENYIETFVHAIKSPLQNIKTGLLLLESVPDPKDRDNKETITNIDRDATVIQHIVDNLMQLIKLEGLDKLENKSTIEVTELVDRSVSRCKPRCDQKNIALTSGSSESMMINGDSVMVENALNNLLENAIEFTGDGGAITVDLQKQGDQVLIIITDTGVGIPTYAQEKIFQRYYSLPRPHTKSQSSGLGLNYVQAVARLHNGGVKVNNRHDTQGVCAILRLAVNETHFN